MRVNIRFMQRLITLIVSLGTISILILLLSACGANTDSAPAEKVPPLVTPVEKPYVLGNNLYEVNPLTGEITRLYEVDPQTGEKQKLLESSMPLLLLDTDQSGSQDDEDTTTVLPEYALYVVDQALWVYELQTRQNIELVDFAATDSTPGQTICELQKVITIDVEQLKDKIVSFKEEPAVYVKTSENNACDSGVALVSYTKIIIAESFTETYTIRQEEITENEDGEEELEPVAKTLPVLVGKKRYSEEALMYAGKPIVDLDTKEFGYLGLDQVSGTYKFFITDPETLEKSEIWSITREEFKTQPEADSRSTPSDLLFSGLNRPSPYIFTDKALLAEHNWKIIKFNYVDLFDDDRDREREFSLDNPIFERSVEDIYTKADLRYHPTAKIIAVRDQDQLMTIANDSNHTLRLVRTMNDTDLSSFLFRLIDQHLITLKKYPEGTAITAIELSSGKEQTLRGLTPDYLSLLQGTDDSSFVSIGDTSSWQTQIYTKALAPTFPTPLLNTMWKRIYDGRGSAQEGHPYLIYAGIMVDGIKKCKSDSGGGPTLFNPRLFRYDGKNSVKCGQGEYFGVIPSVVGAPNGEVYLFSDTYGYVKTKKSVAEDAAIETYYFNPSQPGEMQLMYKEASDL